MNKERKKQYQFHVELDKHKKNKSYEIKGLDNCYFPYAPYSEQIKLIKCIAKTIQSKCNALIQSPTGTGKTLCLLVGALSECTDRKNKNSKIFYLTRTHSQISQVVSQIQKTAYDLKLNIIASRDHLCINPNLAQLKGRALQKGCGDLTSQSLCLFKQMMNKQKPETKPMNLEGFKQMCKKQFICPFFYSKELTQKTELTIMPFNYFLDWKLYETFQDLIESSIIIFDEAHNVDNVAEQGSNLFIESEQINCAINQIKSLQKNSKIKEFSKLSYEEKEIEEIKRMFVKLHTSIKNSQTKIFTTKDQLQQFIENSTIFPDPQNIQKEFPGFQLSDSGLIMSKLNKILRLFYKRQINSSIFQNVMYSLEKISYLYKDKDFQKNFNVSISQENNRKILRLKCMTPALAFKKILEAKPRSIILSSGTLGNLQVWEKYLNVPFKEKVKIRGFINQNQLFSLILSRSSNNYPFQFNFLKKDSQNQHRQLAQQLKNIQNIVPNGIIVAFSTYALMQKVIKYCGILTKKVFFQSKSINIESILTKYSQAAKNQGAFLFIVMKGRFSQGINFNDQLCRCLLIVGIPFLPTKQPSVSDKMKYLEENFSKKEADQWYMTQTFQPVNQTIGRIIRNKSDYGVIILVDQRYQKKDNLDHLSEWFRNTIRSSSQNVSQQIKKFYEGESWLKNYKISQNSTDLQIEETNITKQKKQSNHFMGQILDFSTPKNKNKIHRKLKIVDDSEQKDSNEKTIPHIISNTAIKKIKKCINLRDKLNIQAQTKEQSKQKQKTQQEKLHLEYFIYKQQASQFEQDKEIEVNQSYESQQNIKNEQSLGQKKDGNQRKIIQRANRQRILDKITKMSINF